jgi:crotonyl-CoA carboxylase/reductase
MSTMRSDADKIPTTMLAAVIRRERYGRPRDAFRIERVSVPPVGDRQVLLTVMAAGVNYNGVWAAVGAPVDLISARQQRGHPEDFHIAGSDASGIVRAVGVDVKSVRVGDEVIVSCGQHPVAANRPDEKTWTTAGSEIWGYETNYGAFAQFTLVDEYSVIRSQPRCPGRRPPASC